MHGTLSESARRPLKPTPTYLPKVLYRFSEKTFLLLNSDFGRLAKISGLYEGLITLDLVRYYLRIFLDDEQGRDFLKNSKDRISVISKYVSESVFVNDFQN